MDPYQLLEATQKAIGDSSLNERHKELIARSGQAKTMGTVGAPCSERNALVPCYPCMRAGCFSMPTPLAVFLVCAAHSPAGPCLCSAWECMPSSAPLPPQSLAALKEQLAKLEAENKALERDADRFRKRQELQRKLGDVHKKARARPRLGARLHHLRVAQKCRAIATACLVAVVRSTAGGGPHSRLL